jgi:glutathione S-transferase
MASTPKPILWHIAISHYSEKARWALAYKGVEHERRAPQPGWHMAVALRLTRGKHKTLPVLQLDGMRIGDSSAVIAALEKRFPEPRLYPEDHAIRTRALELEEWFDEELGPPMRLLAWHEMTHDQARLENLMVQQSALPLARARRAAAATARSFVNLRFGVKSEEAAERARHAIVAGLDHLEQELGDRDYLAGDSFSVADLTAASLFYPLVLPPEGPQGLADPPEPFERFRAPLKERRGYQWVEEMFRRHRESAAG